MVFYMLLSIYFLNMSVAKPINKYSTLQSVLPLLVNHRDC